MEHKDENLLDEIVNYCHEIINALDEFSVDFDRFSSSSALRGMFAFFVQQIGECANKLSPQFKKSHAEIKWELIVGFRHRIVHGYGVIDSTILWDAIQNDIPELCTYCTRQLDMIQQA